jgi:hypothetical protein
MKSRFQHCLPSEPTNTRQFIQTAGRIWHKSYHTGPTVSRVFSTLLKPLRPPSVYYAIVWKTRLTFTAAAIIFSCVDCEKPPSTYKLGQSQGFALILDVLHGRDPSSRSFTNVLSLTDMIEPETCWNGTLNPSDLQSLLSSGMPPPVSISFAKFQEFRKRFIKFVSPLSEAAVQMEILHSSCPQTSPPVSLRQRATAANRSHIPSLHPSFRPTIPVNVLPSNRPRRCSSTPPPSRNLTQTYFTITSSGSDAVMCSSVSLRTIPFHEHLTLQQNKHIYSSTGRVFHHEDTEPPSPLGLIFHEPPD